MTLDSRSRTLLIATLCLAVMLVTPARADSELVFESRGPGDAGGSHSFSASRFAGHTFRLTERTRITEVGFYADERFVASTVFAAIHQIGMVESAADVANDSRLKASALISLEPGDAETVSAAVDVILEPGWYSLVFGKGRYGAGSSAPLIGMRNTGTVQTPVTRGPFNLDPVTNQRTLVGASTRYFALGETLPPAAPPPRQFLAESAGPAANPLTGPTSGLSASTLTDTAARGERFELTRPAELESVVAWLSAGSGEVYAAVFPVSGPTAWPPAFSSPGFEAAAMASVALPARSQWDESIGELESPVLLPPGHYVVLLGSGRFGTSGSAGLIDVFDEINQTGSVVGSGSSWVVASNNYRIALNGRLVELTASPDALDFGTVPLEIGGQDAIEVTIWGDQPVTFDGISIEGADSAAFGLLSGPGSCLQGQIPGGSTCSIGLSFSPDRLGAHQAALHIAGQGLEDSYPVSLTGMVIAGQADLQIDRDNVDFGLVRLDERSDIELLTLSNSGTASVPIDGLEFSSAMFLRDGGDCPTGAFLLPPAQTCTLGLAFEPEAPGPISGALVLVLGEDLDPVTIDLSGDGLGPAQVGGTVISLGRCELEPTPLANAEVTISGQTESLTVFSDPDGEYEATLFDDQAPLSIQFSAAGHLAALREGISLTANELTLLDVELTALLGCYALSETALAIELEIGASGSLSAVISNSGPATGTLAIQSSADWLTALPMSGQIGAGDSLILSIEVSAVDTLAGSEDGVLSLQISDGGEPVELSVTISRTVLAPDDLFQDRFEEGR
ncbi:MAG: carboxypeptidase regulatory-like domain-containing protein [Wenzhouxiangellaceae bacterium]|nr:MAG: carboxypeptidase regulatory-like domain-containing protein [Wenzhouxiangellaceae bacterium]